MSKELEALERIENGKYFVDFELDAKIGEDYEEEIAIIKTALKRLEELEKIEYKQNVINDFYPNTKEMLDDLLTLCETKILDNVKDGESYTRSAIIEITGFAIRYVKTFAYGGEFNETEKIGIREKKLKAFELIIEKRIDLKTFVVALKEEYLTYDEYYEYADEFHYYIGNYELNVLTQEEYDLLKEALL